LEAGSGADRPVPARMVSAVRKETGMVLIVGGGIRTPDAAAERVKAGADIIVTGTLAEDPSGRLEKLTKLVKAVKSAR